jgi:hypothetical protein
MRCLLVLVVLASLDRPADACSVVSTFIPPTNVELVATTPAIVVAKATRAVQGRDLDEHAIELTITRVIKGPLKIRTTVRVRGSTMKYRGASKPDDFSRARPGAYTGSCTAWDYKLGKHYLLFLEQYRGRWNTRGTPFTRVNEEVAPKGDAWTAVVTEYARITALPDPAARRKALDALAARGGKAVAADVQHHLAAATPYKSFAELDAMYRAAATPQERNRIALAIGVGGDRAARAFMKDLVASLRAGTATIDRHIALDAIGAYYLKVSDPPVLGQIAELYVALGTAAKQARWDVMWLLIKRADASHQNVMERALAGADDEEAGRLVAWFVTSPSENARKEVRRRLGRDYSGKYELTLGLAGMGDKDVLAWAKQELAKPAAEWVALYAIAMSPLPEADALVPAIIARGGTNLVTLIQGYEKAHHPRAEVRLRELAQRKLEPEAQKWLARTREARATPP